MPASFRLTYRTIWSLRSASGRCPIPQEGLQKRNLVTLGIETSCDDTAVAILRTHDHEVNEGCPSADLLFNERITADSARYQGIHPLVALESHQRNLAPLIHRALNFLPATNRGAERHVEGLQNPPQYTTTWQQRPDFISVTRGPGMGSNLAVGLDTAKGLATAWQIPILGVHHMQAHALTPGLVAALEGTKAPNYPFLSLMVSGGHTMLMLSSSLTDHQLLADTDIALGSFLDKVARIILPTDLIDTAKSTMYGALLERFAFPGGRHYKYKDSDANLHIHNPESYPWCFQPPLQNAKGGTRKDDMEFSFSGLLSAAERFLTFEQLVHEETRTVRKEQVREEERRALAREVMRVAFDHVASRIMLALKSHEVKDLVVSGGVASNQYLRHILAAWIRWHGHGSIQMHCPPPALCTDNAAMIAWAGTEMYKSGWRSGLSISGIRKWPLSLPGSASSFGRKSGSDSKDTIVGVLGADGWHKVV